MWVEDDTFDWRDASMYFILTDRFNDGDASNNNPISDHELKFPANWQGGDFKGITAKINDGYFDDMGSTACGSRHPSEILRALIGARMGKNTLATIRTGLQPPAGPATTPCRVWTTRSSHTLET